jgi:hypothetical protein
MAGSEESLELINSLALRFPTKPDERWEAAEPPAEVEALITAGNVGTLGAPGVFFFLVANTAFLSSRRKTAESSDRGIALIKATCS